MGKETETLAKDDRQTTQERGEPVSKEREEQLIKDIKHHLLGALSSYQDAVQKDSDDWTAIENIKRNVHADNKALSLYHKLMAMNQLLDEISRDVTSSFGVANV